MVNLRSWYDPRWVIDFVKMLFTGEIVMAHATIVELPDGGFALRNRYSTIETYARKRDARRGAARRGLVVA